MQKLLSALVAILSFAGILSGMTVAPVTAQDRPAANGHDAPTPNSANPVDAQPMVVPPGITLEDVEVKDRPLIIEGDVRGSVHAVNSKVTLMPGATIEGNLTLEGGSLSASTAPAGLIATRRDFTSRPLPAAGKRGNWFGAQFCLWALGLAGGLIVLVAAPHATSRVSETVSMRPGRSLFAGLIAGAAMLSALAISGLIMKSNTLLTVVWMPVTIVVALVSLVLLVFGWLAGMRRIGDILARRFGQTGSGTFYGRMTLGLTAFFAFNAIVGSLIPPLGVVGLLVEFAVALMGIGAVVQSAFGRDDQWLGRRFGRAPGTGLG